MPSPDPLRLCAAFFSLLAGQGSRTGGPEWAAQGPRNAPPFPPSLPKCQTAGIVTLSFPAEERTPPRAPPSLFGPSRPSKVLQLGQEHRSPPREEGKGSSLILSLYSLWSHHCAGHTLSPNSYHNELSTSQWPLPALSPHWSYLSCPGWAPSRRSWCQQAVGNLWLQHPLGRLVSSWGTWMSRIHHSPTSKGH